MQRVARWLIAAAPVALTACGSDYPTGYVPPPPGTYANLQVVNTSPDAPPIDVLLDGTTVIRHLDYAEGTGEQPIPPGSHSLTIQIETPGTPTTVVGPTTLDAAANMDYVVAVEGNVGTNPATITTVVFPHTLALVPAQSTQIQVLNATSGPAALAVYLTAPGADLASSTPLGTAPYQGSVGPTQVAAGTWQMRLAETDGTSAPVVVYDSGTITLAGGTDVVFSVLETPPAPPQYGGPPVTAVAPTPQMSAVDAFGNVNRLPPAGTGALLRIIHASPDAPALVVNANGTAVAGLPPTFIYGDSTAYLGVTPGLNTLTIAAADNPGTALASKTRQLDAGSAHSLYALGTLAQIFPFITHDDYRPYATQARLRLIQGSPSANQVDVYLTASGAGIASATPTYAALPFATDTGYVSYAQGNYDLTVTSAGSKTPLVGPIATSLPNGGTSTVVVSDAPGGGPPYGLIQLY
jgi:hypothetical protein